MEQSLTNQILMFRIFVLHWEGERKRNEGGGEKEKNRSYTLFIYICGGGIGLPPELVGGIIQNLKYEVHCDQQCIAISNQLVNTMILYMYIYANVLAFNDCL